MAAISCQEFAERAPDVALGLLSGDERAVALEHLAHCPTCRDHLEGLIRVADGLLLLAPAGEPPIGFETRVMARLAGEGAFGRSDTPSAADPGAGGLGQGAGGWHGGPRRSNGRNGDGQGGRRAGHRLRSPAAALIAAVVVVVGGVAGLLASRSATTRHPPLAAQVVEVRADDNSGTCRLVAFPGRGGRPAELVIHLDEPGEPTSSYSVVADRANGDPAVTLGTIDVSSGQGVLDLIVPAGTGPIDGVRILEAGRTHYRAAFNAV